MELAKLQTPRMRSKKGEEGGVAYPDKTMKQELDGSVSVTKVDQSPQEGSALERGPETGQNFPLTLPA